MNKMYELTPQCPGVREDGVVIFKHGQVTIIGRGSCEIDSNHMIIRATVTEHETDCDHHLIERINELQGQLNAIRRLMIKHDHCFHGGMPPNVSVPLWNLVGGPSTLEERKKIG
jgi:hypothetical protein